MLSEPCVRTTSIVAVFSISRRIADFCFQPIERHWVIELTFHDAWLIYEREYSLPRMEPTLPNLFRVDPLRNPIWKQGCVGVTQCMMGRYAKMGTKRGWFETCYTTLAQAQRRQKVMNSNDDCCDKGQRNLKGKDAGARIVAYSWMESPINRARRGECADCGYIYWRGAVPERGNGLGLFDFGCYDEDRDAFWHANYSEGRHQIGTETRMGRVLISTPKEFTRPGSNRSVVYCVVCEGREILDARKL